MEISPWQNIYCQQSPNFFFSCCFPSKFDWIKLTIWRLSVTYTRASVIFFMQAWHTCRMVIFRHQTLTLFIVIIERIMPMNIGILIFCNIGIFIFCNTNQYSLILQIRINADTPLSGPERCLGDVSESRPVSVLGPVQPSLPRAILFKKFFWTHWQCSTAVTIPMLGLGMEDACNSISFSISSPFIFKKLLIFHFPEWIWNCCDF